MHDGVSLSSDGTIVAIGAQSHDGVKGTTRIYAWNGSAWVKRGSDIDGEAAGDRSGTSVSISGDGTTIAIGAPYNDGNGYQLRPYAHLPVEWHRLEPTSK